MAVSTSPSMANKVTSIEFHSSPNLPKGGPHPGSPFSFASATTSRSRLVVRPLTRILTVALVIVSAFAVWSWFRPYDWNPDPGARFVIHQARLTRDHSYYWLDLYLKGSHHDLSHRILLETASGATREPADTTFSGEPEHPEQGMTEIWVRFYLPTSDLEGPLKLRLNEGHLQVRKGTGVPELENGKSAMRLSSSW